MTQKLKSKHVLREPLERMTDHLRGARDYAEKIQRLAQQMTEENPIEIAGEAIRWQDRLNEFLSEINPILNIVVKIERGEEEA